MNVFVQIAIIVYYFSCYIFYVKFEKKFLTPSINFTIKALKLKQVEDFNHFLSKQSFRSFFYYTYKENAKNPSCKKLAKIVAPSIADTILSFCSYGSVGKVAPSISNKFTSLVRDQ